MKNPYPVDHINAAYELLLERIENGDVKAAERPLVDKLLTKTETFREGTLLADHANYIEKTKTEYEKELQDIRAEYEKEQAGAGVSEDSQGEGEG